jgi:methylenetetrahydrofolate dehydrogenase (NADP+)/methenyltetrahydrofolate cyclohydrolase
LDTIILKGRDVSSSIKEELSSQISDLKLKGITPCLAAIIAGDNPASKLYVNSKAKTFKKMDCDSEIFTLSSNVDEKDLLSLIEKINNNSKFHGILVQLPLPKHLNEKKILEAIKPEKDVDGFHPKNQGYLMQGNPSFIPCTPYGCLKILEHYNISTNGKNIVVIGRSNIVGKPIASLLSQNAKYGNGTVTLCHSRTKNLSDFTKKADIIIAAVGIPNLIKKDMIKDGADIIDVGINRIDDKSREKGYRVVGDVDFDNVLDKASSITPVPGGVGVMTVTMLLSNTVKAALNQIGES